MYYNARWYDPALGRFTQADSIVPPWVQGLDRYAYANNNPILFIDPSGHSSCVGRHADDGPDCAEKEWSDVSIQIEIDRFQDECQEGKHGCDEIADAGELAASVLFEPADWAFAANHCAHGDCSPWMLAGFLPFISSSAARHLDEIPWKSIVDSDYWKIVKGAFRGEPKGVELTEDTKVFRHFGVDSIPTDSPWFSSKAYERPGNARRYLSLPDSNLATNVAEFVIPKGTRVMIGEVADKTADTVLFGSHAVGGGIQIYLPDPTVARLIK